MLTDETKMEIISCCGELAGLWMRYCENPSIVFTAKILGVVMKLEEIAGDMSYRGGGHRLSELQGRMVCGDSGLPFICAVTHIVRSLKWEESRIYSAIMSGCAEIRYQIGVSA